MKEKSKLQSRNITVDKLYFGLSLLLIVFALISIIVSKGENFENLFWHGATLGYYPDLFESVIHARTKNPYEIDAIYPAFAYCLIYFFNFFIPGTYTDNFDDLSAICSNSEALVIAHIFYAAITLAIAYFIVKAFGDKKYVGKYLLVFIFITSSPFIFLIERGNTVIITIVFLFIYLFYYNSENKKLRELALICLACAATMKLYPAVFGLLLLADKRYKEAVRAVIYGVLLFVVPFFFMGGIGEIPTMLKNSLTLNSDTLTGSTGFGYGFKVNATSSIGCILDWLFGKSYSVYIKMVVYFVVGLLIGSVFFHKSSWKKVASLSLIVILMPDFSFIYNVIYLLPVLVMFIRENKGKKLSFSNLVYTLCFVGAFAPLPYGDIFRSIGGYNNMNWGTLVSSMSLILLALLMAFEGVYRCLKSNYKKVIALILAVSVVLGAVPFVLNSTAEPEVQSIESVWSLTDEEKKGVEELYDFVASNLQENNKVLCFPKTESLDIFNQVDNHYWYSTVEAKDSITATRNFKKLDPQFVVVDLSNYSNYRLLVENEELDKKEYESIFNMQRELIDFANENDYKVVKYVFTENDRCIAVWEKEKYVKNADFWYESGKGTEKDPYIISTPEQLKAFSEVTNCGKSFRNEYIKLGNDIDASSIGRFRPISKYNAVSTFEGVFDGGGHTISKLNLKYEYNAKNSETTNIAFVNNLSGAIMNLCIEDSTFVGSCCAVFVRVSNSAGVVVINCISRNNTVKGSSRAGSVADKYGASIINCIAVGNELNGKKSEGFISIKDSNANIVNCYTDVLDKKAYASTVSEEYINTALSAKTMNEYINNFNSELEETKENLIKKKKKKEANKIKIYNYSQWTIKDGTISFK
ncbi:MAG: glycosyltransferase family 87 protein [Eubacterium sp.]